MKLSDVAIRRPVTTLMLVLMILVLGAVSLSGLSLDMFPDISLPTAVVFTEYQGAGPQEIETMITKPLEQVMGTVDNFKKVSSISSSGSSQVIVEFTQGTNMDYAALQMREKVDMIKAMLPADASNPIIFQYDLSMFPIMQLGVSGESDLVGLKTMVEDRVKDRLERIKGVAAVDIIGGMEREIKVNILPHKLKGYGLSTAQVVSLIRAENLNLPGGELQEGNSQLIIRTIGELKHIDEIGELPITTAAGVIKLKDIAEITDEFKDVTTAAYMNGKPCVLLQIKKQSGFNTVKVSDKVNAELERIKIDLKDLKFQKIFDQSDYIKRSLGSVTQNAIGGGILAIFILFIFLKNIRTTFIIGIAIPISIIATFVPVYFSGITLNMLSMGGLALGIGMLVDNAIVVLESIFRYCEEGYNRIEAAKKGSEEVAMAVTASTLTTIAVFLPIAFVKDNIAIEMFKELALTVTYSLLASLVVSLTLVPMLASKIIKIEREEDIKKKLVPIRVIDQTFNKVEHKIETSYKKFLHWSIFHRKIVILGTVALLVVSMIVAALFMGAEFFPESDEGIFTVKISLPKGMIFEETAKLTNIVEKKILEFNELEYIFSVIGSGGMYGIGDPSSSMIYASFGLKSTRDKGINELVDEVRNKLKNIPGAKISVEEMQMASMGGSGKPITIKISGDDFEQLQNISERLVEQVKQIEGTREISSDIEESIPEAQISVNRAKASQYGISVYTVANTIQNAIMGNVATKYKVDGEEIGIRVRLASDSGRNIQSLENIIISSPMGFQIPLYDIADIKLTEAPASIRREEQVRVVSISGGISGRSPSSVFRDVKNLIDNTNIPSGYSIQLAGESENMTEAFIALGLILVLAIILVYMIMASQFESLLHPFTIMFSVPLSFIGVAFTMAIARQRFSVPAFIGVIILAGVVVNNAIVLVDYINILRDRGMERDEAIMNAGPVRLRPILMTTLTTLLGLIPLALGIGQGAELQTPLALTVIGGLGFSTLLTLIFIPIMYTLFDDLGENIKKWRVRKKKNSSNIELGIK